MVFVFYGKSQNSLIWSHFKAQEIWLNFVLHTAMYGQMDTQTHCLNKAVSLCILIYMLTTSYYIASAENEFQYYRQFVIS